jgi:TRAP-type C4-dicarboxylate transport system permease small subunit
LKKLGWILGNIPELVAGAAFCVMLIVVFVNVVLRYALNYSIIWCEEIAAIGFIWSIFVGAAACYKRKGLIGIDVFIGVLPEFSRRIVQIVVDAFMVAANLLLCYLSLSFSIGAWTKISLSMRISYTYFDIATTVGFAFMSYYAIKHLIGDIQGRKFVHPDGETV